MALGELSALFTSVAALTKTAVPQAVAIIGDDVAVNARQLQGLPPGRTIPALLKVVKGSLINKAVIIPAAVLLGWAVPPAIPLLLAAGGFYLTSEGMEQLHRKKDGHKVAETEKEKVADALKVDAIVSGEITVLTLGLVAGAPLLTQFLVLAATGAALTGVLYGAIGSLINMEDAGKWLQKRAGGSFIAKAARKMGAGLGKSVPGLMKAVSVIGTAALFVVGGELLVHGILGGEHLVSQAAAHLPVFQGVAEHALLGVAGLAASLVSYPVMQRLEGPLGKLVDKISHGYSLAKEKFRKHLTRAPAANDNAPAAAAPEASVNALRDASAKTALNDAAQPKAKASAAPAPQKQPKIAP